MKRIALILFAPLLGLVCLWAVIDFVLLPAVADWSRTKISELTKDAPVDL